MNQTGTATALAVMADAEQAHRKGQSAKAFELAKRAWDQAELEQLDSTERALIGSWYGYLLATVGGKAAEGLDLCRAAAKKVTWKPHVYENLALLESEAGWRKRAVDALGRGLRQFPKDPYLNEAKEKIGWRADPVVPFLARSNPVNKTAGRIRHAKKKATDTGESAGPSRKKKSAKKSQKKSKRTAKSK